MPDRYEELSEDARKLVDNFDEIDLADMLATAMDTNAELRQQLARATEPRGDGIDAVLRALVRAEALGWRTITIRRLRALAGGDIKQMPPDPATAPPSARGSLGRVGHALEVLFTNPDPQTTTASAEASQ